MSRHPPWIFSTLPKDKTVCPLLECAVSHAFGNFLSWSHPSVLGDVRLLNQDEKLSYIMAPLFLLFQEIFLKSCLNLSRVCSNKKNGKWKISCPSFLIFRHSFLLISAFHQNFVKGIAKQSVSLEGAGWDNVLGVMSTCQALSQITDQAAAAEAMVLEENVRVSSSASAKNSGFHDSLGTFKQSPVFCRSKLNYFMHPNNGSPTRDGGSG